jgi:hypothetical protein
MSILGRRGFRFAETMSGTYALTARPDDHRRLTMTLEARAPSLLGHLRTGETRVSGTVDADGLATSRTASGTLSILPLQRRIVYDVTFDGDDGRPYRLTGEKNVRLGELRRTMTELPAKIVDDTGAEIATCLVRFDLQADFVDFLASWRLA